MNTNTLIILAVAVVLMAIAGWAAFAVLSGMRRKKLRERFGSEYDYAVEHAGNRLSAEQELAARQKRVDSFDIQDLSPGEQARFHEAWYDIQAGFVDSPSEAIEDANRLIKEVMAARGFPVDDFEQRAADLSVMYPEFVKHYRSAHAIAVKNRSHEASTEELRQAMVHDRAMYSELVGDYEADGDVDYKLHDHKNEKEKELVTK